MSRVRVVICRVEDEEAGERTTEVARFDLPETDLSVREAGTGRDALEEVTHQHGQAVLRGVLQAQGCQETADTAPVMDGQHAPGRVGQHTPGRVGQHAPRWDLHS